MKQTAENGICPECGFDESLWEVMPHHLRPGTVLAGKYMFGKAIGEGGFGITYIGIDLNLNLRVAIKEYFPSGCVTRNSSVTDTVTVFSGDMMTAFNTGKEKFIEEARRLAQFNDSDGIVSVKDFFLENGTAYIVMEYLEGETLKSFLTRRGGKLSVAETLNMIEPILKSLSQLHQSGLIHRDISPDNIIITKSNKVKLIDFGAARDISSDGQRSLSVQLKPGYAPEEQYRSHGTQGSWTDVYALCATIYRMITGQVPVESLDRLHDDCLSLPSALGTDISPQTESVIMMGLAVDYRQRLQSVGELYNALYNNKAVNQPTYPTHTPPVQAELSPEKQTKKLQIALIVTLSILPIAVIVLIIVLFTSGVIGSNKSSGDMSVQTPAPTVTVSAPTPVSTPTPLPPRPDRYSSACVYKRMDSIHNSALVDDETYLKLKEVILDFDKLCVEYMNNGNPEALKYLPSGTTAYSQQTEYKAKHPTIYEILNAVDVINARYDGTSYYVWVMENMTVIENGEKRTDVDYWVYKLQKNNSGYVILDYTHDPLND